MRADIITAAMQRQHQSSSAGFFHVGGAEERFHGISFLPGESEQEDPGLLRKHLEEI